jgi:hypothetical protein
MLEVPDRKALNEPSDLNQPEEFNMSNKVIALALIVLGIGLAFWGYQLSGSVGSQLTRAFSGSDTDKVMMFYIGGAVSFVIGAFLFIKK